MVKVFTPSFTIKIASKPKRKVTIKSNDISRRCLAVVTKIDNEYKAIVNYDKRNIDVTNTFTLNNEQLVLPFTENSLNLRNKIYVWYKDKDEYGHNVCFIRDKRTARIYPGIKTQYDAVKEDTLISGYIIRREGKMYFEYEDLVAFNYLSESRLINIVVDYDKPLFSK